MPNFALDIKSVRKVAGSAYKIFRHLALFLLITGCVSTFKVNAAAPAPGEEFKPTPMILHHVSDDYMWDIGAHIMLPLPMILYKPGQGWDVFLSSEFHYGDNVVRGYRYNHGLLEREDGAQKATLFNLGSDNVFYDFSITKNVTALFASSIIIFLLFFAVAKGYSKRRGMAPKGIQSFMEPVILYVRDQIAIPSIGHNYRKYLPYLLSLFFFIWINNLLGLFPLFPGAANVTGNIAVTMALAFLTLIIVNVNGNKHYWAHILWPPGVPVALKLPLALIEVIGIFTKPFALMIRLFANITAGHIIVLSIISLIFIFGQASTAAGFGVSLVVVPFSVFMFLLELMVAALQAFIFTILTALFIGQAVEEPAHH